MIEQAARSVRRIATPEEADRAPLADRRRRDRSRRLSLPLAGRIGLAIVGLLVVVSLFGPFVVQTDPDRQDLLGRLASPVVLGGDWSHPFGTDALGRDILARVVAGARVSLTVGVVATLIAGAVGVALGLVAGYAGGIADRAVSFVVDIQMAIPFVVVAIGVVAVLGNSYGNVIAVLVVTGWVGYARIVRLQAMSLRHAPYVESARAIGLGPVRLMARHILPNLVAPVIVVASQQVAALILYEAALSYLGLGVPGDVVTWGGMVADGRESLLKAWWVSTIPGVAIALTVLGFNLLGDGVRDRFDPRLRAPR